MSSRALPECIVCRFGAAGFPCRRADGRLDLERIARAIVERGRLFDGLDGELPDEELLAPTSWVSFCEAEIVQEHPDLVIPLIVKAMDACETLHDAGMIAAGLVEDAVVKHAWG